MTIVIGVADSLVRRIAEKTLGAFIPGRDDAVESLADNSRRRKTRRSRTETLQQYVRLHSVYVSPRP